MLIFNPNCAISELNLFNSLVICSISVGVLPVISVNLSINKAEADDVSPNFSNFAANSPVGVLANPNFSVSKPIFSVGFAKALPKSLIELSVLDIV